VRGYDTNTLGPMDSNRRSIGGNFMAVGSLGLIFPNFINPDNLRTTAFIDAGNVYNTKYGSIGSSSNFRDSGPVRYSAGIGVEWRIPVLGLLNFSVARALNAQRGDREQFFQFSFGRNF
jgi:outer membrane protein insertion porin family